MELFSTSTSKECQKTKMGSTFVGYDFIWKFIKLWINFRAHPKYHNVKIRIIFNGYFLRTWRKAKISRGKPKMSWCRCQNKCPKQYLNTINTIKFKKIMKIMKIMKINKAQTSYKLNVNPTYSNFDTFFCSVRMFWVFSIPVLEFKLCHLFFRQHFVRSEWS